MSSEVKSIPKWLKRELPHSASFYHTQKLIGNDDINTVCKSANCPNKWECFSRGTATFLLMGDICTRNCLFCGVAKGCPKKLDSSEPNRIAKAVKKLSLKHAVITSVTRDDLPDYGAGHFVKTIREIRKGCSETTIEVLVPDFLGDKNLIKKVMDAKPDIFAHNVEMVPRLYPILRDKASYERSLEVLSTAEKYNKNILIKSGFMVGLAEKDKEVIETMKDLFNRGVDIITIGQYLRPKKYCIKVVKFVAPNKFKYYYLAAKRIGFKYAYSGPLVRSSYKAEEILQRFNGGVE